MDTKANSTIYNKVYDALKEVNEKLLEVSQLDLSQIHIGQDWSWIPYAKDHLDFVIEQVNGLKVNLKDEPPPVIPEELDILRGSSNPDFK